MAKFASAQEELNNSLRLLQLEREEERRQIEEYISTRSLDDRRKAGLCWYPLLVKETGYGLGDYPYMVVERTGHFDVEHAFSGGKVVGLFSNHPNYKDEVLQGTVHYVSGSTMKINFTAHQLPDWADLGKLGVNLLFDEYSYKEMERAVQQTIKAENNRLAQLRDILLGYAAPSYRAGAADQVYLPELNYSQVEAVRHIIEADDVALVHGPPGTGKTTTLVAAINYVVNTEKQVLVCAPSNAAADLLTVRLADKGLKVIRIGNLSRIDDALVSHTLESMLTEHPDAGMVKKLKLQAEEFRRMAQRYKRQFGRSERQQRSALFREARRIADDAVMIENYVIGNILDNAQVVVSTLVGAKHKYIEGRKYKTVFIDEAAQALEPACWVPIAAAQKVVLAGDPFQLPPTVKSQKAAKEGLSVTLLEKNIARLPEVRLLKVQYRMNETIMGFSNQYFYDNQLEAYKDMAHWLLWEGDKPLEYIDTAGAGYEEVMHAETISLFNPGESDTVARHLGLLAQENLPALQQSSIGIISPYRQQVRYMQEHLPAKLRELELQDVTINTIDSFQGQERDIIYISLVRSNDRGEIGFLSDYRRLNVALTRAKKKLVVAGDSATLAQDAFYRLFIDYAEKQDAYVSVYELGQL